MKHIILYKKICFLFMEFTLMFNVDLHVITTTSKPTRQTTLNTFKF